MVCDFLFVCYKVHLESTSSCLVLPLSVYLSIHQQFIEHLLCTKHCSGCLGDSREENKEPCPPKAYLLMEGGRRLAMDDKQLP